MRRRVEVENPTHQPDEPFVGRARHRAMLKMRIAGASHRTIGQAFGISQQRVSQIADDRGWDRLIDAYEKAVYKRIVERGTRSLAGKIQTILDHQADHLLKQIKETPEYGLTPEQQRVLVTLMAGLKEDVRLLEDKPTANTSNIVRHVIELPPGVDYFGVDPPGPNVTFVKQQTIEDKSKDDNHIDVDDIED